MSTYLVCYDLNKEREGYAEANKKLTDAIKALSPTWWHHLDSTWIVVTDLTAAQIRDNLAPYIDRNDELLVVLSGGVGAWRGFTEKGSTWLKDNL